MASDTNLAFWRWFAEHEPELFQFDPLDEPNREAIFGDVAQEIQKVHRDLCFEFGPRSNKRIFVISAGGLKEVFPSVVALSAAAPKFDCWDIIAFRPRRESQVIEFQGTRIDPAEVTFTLLDNGKMAGINLFIPGYREGDTTLKQIGYLLLDDSLGEYDVGTALGVIRMMAPTTKTTGDRYSIKELPRQFDRLVARLRGNSEKVS